jgi:hypothetical protein
MNETTRQPEQRLVLRLLERWRTLAGERAMPAVADIARLGDDIRDDCFVLEDEAGELLFRFVGERQKSLLASDPSSLRVSAIDGETLLGRAIGYRAHVLDRRVPVSVGGQFVDRDGRTILYRSILLPLGENGITALLGCVNGRVVVRD